MRALCHFAAYISDEIVEMLDAHVDESPFIDIRETYTTCLLQSGKPRLIHGFLMFDQAKPFTHDFAGILITPRLQQSINDLLMVFCKNDVSC